MDNQKLAAALQDGLKLERPPIGLAFVDSQPDGVASVGPAAPSACTFWRRAEQGTFFATAADHYQCPVGTMTMGFELPESEKPKAMELVGTMVDLGYFGMEEVAQLPSVQKPHQGIVYGPLAELPVQPDAVLVLVSPYQAMLLAEAGGSTVLKETPGLAAMGRPACSAIPRALNSEQPTVSLGCIGARTYAEIPDDRAMVALPADSLERTVAQLSTMIRANAALAEYHGQKKAQFASA